MLQNVAPTDETPRKPLPRPKRPAETDIAIPEPEITVKKFKRAGADDFLTVDMVVRPEPEIIETQFKRAGADDFLSLSDSDMVELFGSPDSSDAPDENQQK